VTTFPAVCLNNPRHVPIDQISCAQPNGPVPPCTQAQIDNWQQHGDWITLNP
jgi:hypothetical protein